MRRKPAMPAGHQASTHSDTWDGHDRNADLGVVWTA